MEEIFYKISRNENRTEKLIQTVELFVIIVKSWNITFEIG
jgi:hypothetical protein